MLSALFARLVPAHLSVTSFRDLRTPNAYRTLAFCRSTKVNLNLLKCYLNTVEAPSRVRDIGSHAVSSSSNPNEFTSTRSSWPLVAFLESFHTGTR